MSTLLPWRHFWEGFARVDAKFDQLGARIDRLFYIQLAFIGSLALAVLTDKI
ncbi:MAG TPA: hypothetical protein VD761_05620 [Solirubrobacterales bacterium]|nr:hypothetical protein [Solirubrobacterales bacterium]